MCVAWAANLRKNGCRCLVMTDGRSVKAAMKRADKLSARYSVVIGDDDLAKGEVRVRDMGDERPVSPGISAESILAAFQSLKK
jgi:histidyl-tRNA synthetase